MKKNIIMVALALMLAVFSASGADFYSVFEVSASHDFPEEVYVEGAECADTSCSSKTSEQVEVFHGEATTCLNQALAGEINANEFNSCMDDYRVSGGIANTTDSNYIVTKVNLPSSHGFLTYFSAENDEYIPKYVDQSNFNCEYDICIDQTPFSLDFNKKDGGIAEIGQVNIKNTEDELKPIQIEVPVEIEQTVCSAYTRNLPNAWMPSIPETFSDYNADTTVLLEVSKTQTGEMLYQEEIFIPIESDLCVGLAAFEWTPSSDLENTSITFDITTDVVDSQVINAQKDRASVIETIYPISLDNACWTRIEDFTISNEPGFNLDSSIAQIYQGEEVFASLKTGAFRDETKTPMEYHLELSANDEVVFETTKQTLSQELQEESFNVTDSFSGLTPGDYELSVTSTPHGDNCDIRESVTHTQQVTIQEIDEYEVTFNIRDSDQNPLEGAQVSLELLNSSYNVVEEINYFEELETNEQGQAIFSGVTAGNYEYITSKDGFNSKQNTIDIGSDKSVYVTLLEHNDPPVVDLPDEFTARINEGISIDLSQYVSDANQDFSELQLEANILSGEGSVDIQNGNLIVNSSEIGTLTTEVVATDSQGASSSDSTNVVFTDGVEPTINLFEASRTSGEAPLDVNFTTTVEDAQTCTFEAGDGSQEQTGNCEEFEEFSHTFENPGTYTAEFTAENEDFSTSESITIAVFERTDILIQEFSANPTQGVAPLETEFTIRVSESDANCRLSFGDGTQLVDNCSNMEDVGHTYSNVGEYNAELEVTHNGTTRTRSLLITVVQSLQTADMSMDISSEIAPGDFTFDILVQNETLQKREFSIEPQISCGDSTFGLSSNRELTTKGKSSVQRDEDFRYKFRLNTLDFNANIAKDQTCTLSLKVSDEFNSQITLSEDVVFSYPEAEAKTPSIRGETVDITNYMSSVLQNSQRGMNIQEFRIVNHEEEGRDISISLSSTDLGIQTTSSIKVEGNGERSSSLSFSIPQGTSPGMYPVRMTISDGQTSQTRYSYISLD